jgi:hypothetical protein
MPSLNFHSAGRVLITALSVIFLANTFPPTLADPLVNPVSLSTQSDSLRGKLYSMKATDDDGNVHDMIVSTVSVGTCFATPEMICPPAKTQKKFPCGFNPSALYDPGNAVVNSSYCSIGVKFDPNPYIECYNIMPNSSITIGDNTTQNPDLPLYGAVGYIVNTTWDVSSQSGMLGLAAPVLANSAGPFNSVLDDMSVRYSQPRQFTLALNRDPNHGGFLTLGSALPASAQPLNSSGFLKTPMEHATINGRTDDLYVVTAGKPRYGAICHRQR